MSVDLPYMPAVGNVSAILTRIREAGSPPKFSREFLSSSLGFTSSQDRGVIKILKAMGFLSNDGAPTVRYNEFRSSVSGDKALARGLREGWAAIFLADQKAYEKSASQLTETFKSVTGQGEAVAKKMASTFKAFASKADWSDDTFEPEKSVSPIESLQDTTPKIDRGNPNQGLINLHHDVHLHLPPTSDVTVYRAIFQAIREELL